MLVIQRSLRKSASLVEPSGQSRQHSRRCLSCVAEGRAKKAASAPAARRSEGRKFQYTPDPEDIFLEGRPIPLQHRLTSTKHSVQQPVASLCNNQLHKSLALSSACRIKHARKTQYNSAEKTRRSSQSPCEEVESRKTVLQQRKRRARTPLLMSTMSLPNENLTPLTSKEATQRHLNREDAQATLVRLLAARNHQLPSTSTSKLLSSAGETQLGTEEKTTNVKDSYDCLLQHHLQNLNSVIHHHNQQELNQTSQNTQKQKTRVDIYQNCCGGEVCIKNKFDDYELEINRGAHASDSSVQNNEKCDEYFSNYSVLCQSKKTCGLQRDCCAIDSQVHAKIDNNSNLLTPPGGECKSIYRVGTFSEDHVANFRSSSRTAGAFNSASPAMENQNIKASSSSDTNVSRVSGGKKKNGKFLCINVSNQFQDIHLEEVEPAVTKPVITLNHVSENFAAERYEVSVVRPPRSPSPLLEVPQTPDLLQENLRPPLN